MIQLKNFVVLLAFLWSSFLCSQELHKIVLLDFKSNYKFVSLIYAYQNLDDISSVFGHTFLVFHDSPQVSAFDLTVEFSVYINKESVARDYLGAAIGSMYGEYRYNYFYNKKREYELEGRNLFVYRLHLDKTQISNLIMSIKNRKKEVFPYSFFRRNCSYYIQKLVADAGSKKFPVRLAYQPSRFVDWAIVTGLADNKPTKMVMSFNDKSCSPKIHGGCFQLLKSKPNFEVLSESFVSAPPLLESGHISIIKNLSGQGALFDFKESQKSFFQNTDDQFKFSTLEILRFRGKVNNTQTVIQGVKIINMEDLNFRKISKIIDFSYQNKEISIEKRSLIYLDFGLGKGIEFNNFGIHLVPQIRSSIESLRKLESRTRFGGSIIASYAFNSLSLRWKTQVIGKNYNHSRRDSIETNLRFSENFYLQYEWAQLVKDKNVLHSTGVYYTF